MNEDGRRGELLEVEEPDESDPDDTGLTRESGDVSVASVENENSTYVLGQDSAEANMFEVR